MKDPNSDNHFHEMRMAIDRLNNNVNSMRESHERLSEQIATLNKLIVGNGEPSKGIVVRLDRMEQREVRRDAWVKRAIGASVAAVFSFIGLLIKLVSKP